MMKPKRIRLSRAKDPRPGTLRPCFGCKAHQARQGLRGFCSAECRFWAKANRADGCWLWEGTGDRKGYGRFGADGVRWLAHRYAYTVLVGSIPEGHELDHLCKITNCVNPAHLEPVLPAEHARRSDQGAYQRRKTHCPAGHPYTPENTRMQGTGRHCRACESPRNGRKGSNNGNARLTDEAVAEARGRRRAGERVKDLAAEYGVAQSVMSRALTGVTWSHVS